MSSTWTAKERADALCNGMFTGHRDLYRDEIEKAITDAIAAEREACARVAEEIPHNWPYGDYMDLAAKEAIAAAIRARGKE